MRSLYFFFALFAWTAFFPLFDGGGRHSLKVLLYSWVSPGYMCPPMHDSSAKKWLNELSLEMICCHIWHTSLSDNNKIYFAKFHSMSCLKTNKQTNKQKAYRIKEPLIPWEVFTILFTSLVALIKYYICLWIFKLWNILESMFFII